LHNERKKQLSILLVIIILSGFAEIFSLASVLPFLGVLTNPDNVWELKIISSIGRKIGIEQSNQLLIPITIIFVLSVSFAALIRLFNLWFSGQLAARIGSDLSSKAYRKILYQDYSYHLRTNSSDIITAILNHSEDTVWVINYALQLITSIVIVIGLLIAMLVINFKIACLASGIFTSAYIILALTAKKRLSSNGLIVEQLRRKQLKALQEGIGAFREVFLTDSQPFYISNYRKADQKMRIRQAESGFLAGSPKYVLESLGLLLIACLGCLLSLERSNTSNAIPILGTFALGAQRLLPSLQQAYSNWSGIKHLGPGVCRVLDILEYQVSMPKFLNESNLYDIRPNILLKNVSYNYDGDKKSIISNINLQIKCGDRIGITGTTGSGKSTLVDIIMGLIKPKNGIIEINGLNLNDKVNPKINKEWRSLISHVPQSIYLSDSTIGENIAFGIDKKRINIEKVKLASKLAHIDDFINSTENKYDTVIGERGIRLSGGQRQRLGIARALYKEAKLIILDEATSALDTKTEALVMEAIEGLDKDITIIIIAHRLSTLSTCDFVLNLKDGKVSKSY